MFPKGLERELEKFENWRKNQDYPDYNLTKIKQNTEKGSGGLRRLAVT